jgi:hypothetical protein
LPTDVTNVGLIQGLPLGPVEMPKLDPGSAIKRLSQASFPDVEQLPDEDGGIIVKVRKGSDYVRNRKNCLQLTSGSLFVSVRKPARLASITTPHGTIVVAHDGDVIVSFQDGLLRVMNLSGFGERVKVKINQAAVSAKIIGTVNGAGAASGAASDAASGAASDAASGAATDNSKTFGEARTEGIFMAVKYGCELVASDRPLNHFDLNPADGIARRRSALFENDSMAVSEFSLASALNNCDVLLALNHDPPQANERRVLGNLAKMAAVQDYVNGQGGFVARGKQK